MFLLSCDRKYQPQIYNFGSPVHRLYRTNKQCWSVSKTTVYQQTILNSLYWGGTFHLGGFGDIPSSHGDIPVVSYQLFEVESKNTFFSVSFFLPIGSLANDAPSIRDASLLLYVLQDRILSWREHTISYGFHRCTSINSNYLLQFSIFSPTMINIAPWTNNFADSFQLVCQALWKTSVYFAQ